MFYPVVPPTTTSNVFKMCCPGKHDMFLDIREMANAAQSTVSRFLDIEAVHDSGDEEGSDYESVASLCHRSVIFSAE
jgi:hypothetical protein